MKEGQKRASAPFCSFPLWWKCQIVNPTFFFFLIKSTSSHNSTMNSSSFLPNKDILQSLLGAAWGLGQMENREGERNDNPSIVLPPRRNLCHKRKISNLRSFQICQSHCAPFPRKVGIEKQLCFQIFSFLKKIGSIYEVGWDPKLKGFY